MAAIFHRTVLTGILFLFVHLCNALPEQGVWTFQMSRDVQTIAVSKSMYKNSQVSVKITCDRDEKTNTEVSLLVAWVLRWSPCAQEYVGVQDQLTRINHYFMMPELNQIGYEYGYVHYQSSGENAAEFKCEKENTFTLKDLSGSEWVKKKAIPVNPNTGKNQRKRTTGQDAGKDIIKVPTTSEKHKRKARSNMQQNDHPHVTKTCEDGIFLFILKIQPEGWMMKDNVTINIWMKGPHGYLSAIDRPLLPFYGAMCIVYLLCGIVWLTLIAYNWRDTNP